MNSDHYYNYRPPIIHQICLHNYPLSKLIHEYEMYFTDLVQPWTFFTSIDDIVAFIKESDNFDIKELWPDYPNNVIENVYIKLLWEMDQNNREIEKKISEHTPLDYEDEIQMMQQIEDLKNQKVRRETRRVELINFRNHYFIQRHLTPDEEQAIKLALIILEAENERVIKDIPYYTTGSSIELLWLLILYKETCGKLDSTYYMSLDNLNSIMVESGLAPFQNIVSYRKAVSDIHEIINTAIAVLKVRADSIMEIEMSRKMDSHQRFTSLERENIELKTELFRHKKRRMDSP